MYTLWRTFPWLCSLQLIANVLLRQRLLIYVPESVSTSSPSLLISSGCRDGELCGRYIARETETSHIRRLLCRSRPSTNAPCHWFIFCVASASTMASRCISRKPLKCKVISNSLDLVILYRPQRSRYVARLMRTKRVLVTRVKALKIMTPPKSIYIYFQYCSNSEKPLLSSKMLINWPLA